MKKTLTAATLIALFAVGAEAAADDDPAAKAKAQMQETFERLELTDEQIQQVEPVLRASAEARQEILAEYGMDPASRQSSGARPGPRKMRAMRKEMDAVNEDTLGQLEQVLSDEQIAEFNRIQEERRAEMRERMRSANQAP